MDMQAALRARLLAAAPVADPLPTYQGGKTIFWGVRPQGSPLNAITLQTISDPRPQHLKGFQALRSTRVQIDCWSTTYAGARAMAEAVIAAAVPEETVEGIVFNRAMVDDVRDLGEQTDTEFIHRTSIDLIVWWSTEE